MRNFLLAAAAMALALPAYAQEGGAPVPRQINPFSDCGIGAAFFPNAENAWAAVITNVTWDVGTTAVISAVSSPNTCTGGRVKTAMYITQTYASLEAETAVGEGKYLTAMADVMQCSEGVRTKLFNRVRAEVGNAMAVPGFADRESVAKAEIYFDVVDRIASSEFKDACSMT